MQEFKRDELLLFASKLCLMFAKDGGINNIQFQEHMIDLLDDKTYHHYEMLELAKQIISEKLGVKFTKTPIFTALHGLNFIKHVVINHSNCGYKVINVRRFPNSPSEVFSILFQLMDYYEFYDRKDKRFENTQRSLIRTSIFNNRDRDEDLIRRFYQLFFEATKTVKKNRPVDFDKVLQSACGLTIKELFGLGLGIFAKFAKASLVNFNPNTQSDPNEHVLLNWYEHFQHSQIEESTKRALKNIFSISIEDAKQEFLAQEKISMDLQKHLSFEYNLLPFINRPLMEIDSGHHICVHYPFFVEKFTSGIYWMIHDALEEESRGSFRDYWGFLCQEYVEQIFRQDIQEFCDERYQFHFDVPYKKNGQAYSSDVIVFDKATNELFLFEVTYSALRIEVLLRSGPKISGH